MISLPDGITPADIAQWLVGGVCLVVLGESVRPAIVERVLPDGCVRVRHSGDNWAEAWTVTYDSLRAHWPMCGSINVPSARAATYCERQPARQYKRTFNSRQVTFLVPRLWDVRKTRGDEIAQAMQAASKDVLPSLFNPTYPESLDEALGMLETGWLSVAINPRIIIAGDQLGKQMIYYRGELAATITGGIVYPVADALTCRIIHQATKGRFQWLNQPC